MDKAGRWSWSLVDSTIPKKSSQLISKSVMDSHELQSLACVVWFIEYITAATTGKADFSSGRMVSDNTMVFCIAAD